MRKLLLSAVLTLASFAPASAQQTGTVDSNLCLTPVSMVSVYGDAARRAIASRQLRIPALLPVTVA
jgi:hypothetical protein